MKRILTLMAALALVVSMPASVFAQGKYDVKGTVVDKVGPVIGASVIEQDNATNGTITDFDGSFSLKVSGPDAVIESAA